jgi:hypothetical protein
LSRIEVHGDSLSYRLEMPTLSGLAGIVGLGAAAAPGAGGPVDRTFNVRSVHLDGVVAQVDLVAIPQGPVRVQAYGKPDTMKELRIGAVGDEVLIRLDSDESEAWFPWNLFNLWGRDRKIHDLKIKVYAPLGTPYDIEDMVGVINAGDLDAPLRLEATYLTARFGRVQSANVSVAGSGNIKVGAIKETLNLEIAGGGDFEAASAAAAVVAIGGGGDVKLGPLASGLDLKIGGAGDVRVASVNGPVDIAIGGSGDVVIEAGRANPFSVAIGGSGDVLFKGEAVNPEVSIAGSGDVKVGSYTGKLSQSIMGSGDFEVLNHGQQPAPSAPPAGPPAPPAPPQPH